MSAVNDIIRVSVRHILSGIDDQVNVFHFRVATPPTPNTALSHLEDFAAFFEGIFTEFQSQLTNQLAVVDLTSYNLTADTPHGQYTDFGTYTGGTGITDYLPPQDTMLVLLYTGQKRRTGRIYLPTMLENSQDGGFWEAASISEVESGLVYLQLPYTGPNGGEYTPVVYSRLDGVGYPILSLRVQRQVATMRKRKRGRGS